MSEALSRRLKQAQFADPMQEALLSLVVAASIFNDRMDLVCDQYGITRPQYNVLRILRGVYPHGHPRCEIASRMVDRAPDVTRLVDRLQAQRWVKRVRGRDDLRQAVTCITAKGLRLLEKMRPEIDAAAQQLLHEFSAADFRELSRLCALVIESELAETASPAVEI